jgi:hypothetical protein
MALVAPNTPTKSWFPTFTKCMANPRYIQSRQHICIATTAVLPGRNSIDEIKYDGHRLGLERNGDRVRLITKGGYDWSKRYPWIVEAALKNRQKQSHLAARSI